MNIKCHLVVFLLFLLGNQVDAQTILRTDLSQFRCGVKVSRTGDRVVVKSPNLEYWKMGLSNAPKEPFGRIDQRGRISEFTYLEGITVLQCHKASGLVIVPLQPKEENQFQKFILSFWESSKDSLSFLGIAKDGRVAGPGNYRLSKPRKLNSGEIVFFASGENVDAGDVWGGVDVYLFNEEKQQSECVYTEGFSWTWCEDSDSLSAAWAPDEAATIQLVRYINLGFGTSSVDCKNVVVSVDTMSLKAEELSTEW